MGKPQNAVAEFGRALALAPGNAQALNNRGVALLAMGQVDVARQDFQRALEINPCLFDARFNLRRLGVVVPEESGCRYSEEQRRLLGGE
jgi:Flp pilus assembly protein TadD